MTYILLFLILGTGTSLLINMRTRSAQLARWARKNRCLFDREKNSVTTELTAGRLEFFTLFFHQYQNVSTYTDNMAFMRLADDSIFLNENPNTKPIRTTLFTAELKRQQFPALKIAPLKSPFAASEYALMKTNIPAVDSRYRIHAPSQASGLLFTPFIIGLLKTKTNIYLELNDNALIYHEHTLIPPAEMNAFRFRAMQILGEFEDLITRLNAANPTVTATLTPKPADEEELKATAMLRALSASAAPTSSMGAGKSIWVILLFAALVGICFLSWIFLKHLPQL